LVEGLDDREAGIFDPPEGSAIMTKMQLALSKFGKIVDMT